MAKRLRTPRAWACTPLLLLGLACAPSKGDGTLNGPWDVVEEVDAGECNDGLYEESYRIRLVEAEGQVTVLIDDDEFAATLTGNELAWTSIEDEDGGTTTSLIQVRFDEARTEFDGIASWTWNDGRDSCAGTSELSGSRG